jgi:hypothetical protein
LKSLVEASLSRQFANGLVQIALCEAAEERSKRRDLGGSTAVRSLSGSRHEACVLRRTAVAAESKRSWRDLELVEMNLLIWLPALFLVGVAAMGLVFAFAAGCERV